ncbi:MAG TPA: class I SAM-dependent methyltransferase [Candidatus Dependentiae bacterium]|nr:class I SAM-dependent methyltransferase [Candidatus Dependentiae bacterium]HRQ63109.1 class I SAM-dependent methyltransferase [Candidatus Dependentiae bacterium]
MFFPKTFLLLVLVTHTVMCTQTIDNFQVSERRIIVIILSYTRDVSSQKKISDIFAQIDSIFRQKYSNYEVIYIDSHVSSSTYRLISTYIMNKRYKDKLHIITGRRKKEVLANIYYAVHGYCKDDDIVVLVNGTHTFKDNYAFANINQVYNDSRVWLTHNQEHYPYGTNRISHDLVDNFPYRIATWHQSCIETFYAWLFKQIKYDDFLDIQGNILPAAQDMACMLPMLEMAGGNYAKTPVVLSQGLRARGKRINTALQINCESFIRAKEKYKSLSVPVIHESFVLQEHEQWWFKNMDQSIKTLRCWLGDENAESRVKMRKHIQKKGYKNILDVPCGLCTEFAGYIKDGINIKYYGADITPQLVAYGKELGLDVVQASIEDLPYESSFFDVCYARHILEHLSYYKKAIDELIRVANKEVLIIFFIKPSDTEEIYSTVSRGALIYHNQYNKSMLEAYVKSHDKVSTIKWEHINDKESALHIYLK